MSLSVFYCYSKISEVENLQRGLCGSWLWWQEGPKSAEPPRCLPTCLMGRRVSGRKGWIGKKTVCRKEREATWQKIWEGQTGYFLLIITCLWGTNLFPPDPTNCLSLLLYGWDHISNTCSLEEERFILAHSLWQFPSMTGWLLGRAEGRGAWHRTAALPMVSRGRERREDAAKAKCCCHGLSPLCPMSPLQNWVAINEEFNLIRDFKINVSEVLWSMRLLRKI